jgi:hypothetical protein
VRRLKPDAFDSIYMKINSEWIKDINIRPGILELIEENIRKTLQEIGTYDNFLKPKSTGKKKAEIDKGAPVTLTNFRTAAKKAVNNEGMTHRMRQRIAKYFSYYSFHRCLCRIDKKLKTE